MISGVFTSPASGTQDKGSSVNQQAERSNDGVQLAGLSQTSQDNPAVANVSKVADSSGIHDHESPARPLPSPHQPRPSSPRQIAQTPETLQGLSVVDVLAYRAIKRESPPGAEGVAEGADAWQIKTVRAETSRSPGSMRSNSSIVSEDLYSTALDAGFPAAIGSETSAGGRVDAEPDRTKGEGSQSSAGTKQRSMDGEAITTTFNDVLERFLEASTGSAQESPPTAASALESPPVVGAGGHSAKGSSGLQVVGSRASTRGRGEEEGSTETILSLTARDPSWKFRQSRKHKKPFFYHIPSGMALWKAPSQEEQQRARELEAVKLQRCPYGLVGATVGSVIASSGNVE